MPKAGEKSKVELIREVSNALYENTESLRPIATDVCYLLAAIANGTQVSWPQPSTGYDDEADRYTNVMKLFRHLFPPEHRVWKHIVIEPTECACIEGDDLSRPQRTNVTREQFVSWLIEKTEQFCDAEGGSPEETDCGDLWRTLESERAFEAIGVSVLNDPIEQEFYLMAHDLRWAMRSPYEIGIENETVWFAPLNNLCEVNIMELQAVRTRLVGLLAEWDVVCG